MRRLCLTGRAPFRLESSHPTLRSNFSLSHKMSSTRSPSRAHSPMPTSSPNSLLRHYLLPTTTSRLIDLIPLLVPGRPTTTSMPSTESKEASLLVTSKGGDQLSLRASSLLQTLALRIITLEGPSSLHNLNHLFRLKDRQTRNKLFLLLALPNSEVLSNLSLTVSRSEVFSPHPSPPMISTLLPPSLRPKARTRMVKRNGTPRRCGTLLFRFCINVEIHRNFRRMPPSVNTSCSLSNNSAILN